MSDPILSSSESELRAHIERALDSSYDLEKEIGRGGMGIVYRARDKRLKRPVAVKVLPPELGFRTEIRTRFLREAETAAQLSHPNIVPIYSVDEQESLVFFVMACIDGDNIARRLHDRGAFGGDDARRILREVADALAYAHSRGVIHRDIKPDNIILDHESGRPMVTDFGIARAVTDGDSRLTATGIAIGTPAFMSPEQSVGDKEIDGRSDLYSLGVVGYQMLSGRLPFTASNTPAMLMKHISEIPADVQELAPAAPADLCRAVMLLLEKEPARRFQSAEELVHALDTGEVPEREPMGAGVPSRRSQEWTRELDGRSSSRLPAADSDLYDEAAYVPSEEELSRWHAPQVLAFRRRLAYYIPVNAVLLLFALFGAGSFLFATLIWSVIMAVKYAGLWSDGYDWHDIFRQPRHREVLELVSEQIDEVGALFDRDKRQELRERSRRRKFAATGRGAGAVRRVAPAAGAARGASAQAQALAARVRGLEPDVAEVVRRAAQDRDEIVRVVESMPRSERMQVADVMESARALYKKIDLLARETMRRKAVSRQPVQEMDAEIARLEAQANPLDQRGSEARVRRLAQLRRERRAIGELDDRRQQVDARIEECSVALHNMRLDVLRMRAGSETYQNLTLLAERALVLARDVDDAMAAAEEVARVSGEPGRGAAGRA